MASQSDETARVGYDASSDGEVCTPTRIIRKGARMDDPSSQEAVQRMEDRLIARARCHQRKITIDRTCRHI
jgi:hypothetical protein